MKLMPLLSSIWLTGCSVFGIRDVEEPAYTVLAIENTVEIRQYAPRIAAETTVEGSELDARSAGFRRIAGYIFGGNHARASIAMTAPVGQSGGGQSIAMTAPVAQDATAANQWTIRFFMPATSTMQTLPQPNDPAVRLVQEPSEIFAVRRFSGSPSPAAVAQQQTSLLQALKAGAWQPMGAPVAWFYDPPWTIPPLRRNEVAVSVSKAQN